MGSGETLSCFAAPGHPCDEKPQARLGLREKALEAKGHWPCADRFDSFASVAAWRDRAWSAAPFLRLRFPEEEAAGGPARCAGGQAAGWSDYSRRKPGPQGAKSKALSPGPEQA